MAGQWESAICMVSGFVAGTLIGFNGFMWSQSVIVEVYAFSVASFMVVLLCLLVAPIVQPNGEVEIALPPGAWFDLNTRRQFAGRQVLRYQAKLDQFPLFGREGHALPLGRNVQHTGEIDAAAPLDALWIFGKPATSLEGFEQADPGLDGLDAATLFHRLRY